MAHFSPHGEGPTLHQPHTLTARVSQGLSLPGGLLLLGIPHLASKHPDCHLYSPYSTHWHGNLSCQMSETALGHILQAPDSVPFSEAHGENLKALMWGWRAGWGGALLNLMSSNLSFSKGRGVLNVC